jgi:hypothetical protein
VTPATTGGETLLGNGDGTFQAPQPFSVPAGFGPYSVMAGNFGGGTTADLAVGGSQLLQVLDNNGSGTFVAGGLYAFGTDNGAFEGVVADFNNDGKPDLAVPDDNTVSILVGKGSHVCQGVELFPAGAPIATGDFNGDGKPDVAGIVQPPTQSISLVMALGNGDGTFSGFQSITVPNNQSMAVGDFNRDGKLDVAVGGSAFGSGAAPGVAVLLGNGDGTFQNPQTVSTTGGMPLAVDDLRGNGILDLVGTDGVANATVWLGKGDGTFQTAVSYFAGETPVSLIIADVNGDGKPDIVVCSTGLGVLMGNGDGTFQSVFFVNFGAPGDSAIAAAVGDFNHDGIPDLAVLDGTSVTINVVLGLGGGKFGAPVTYPYGSNLLYTQDINGDGNLDLIFSGPSVLLGKGDGTSLLRLVIMAFPLGSVQSDSPLRISIWTNGWISPWVATPLLANLFSLFC